MVSQPIECTAAGKVILCGEHSVVYGQPAIAVPVSGLRAHARIKPTPKESRLSLIASDLGESIQISKAPVAHPLAAIARLTLSHCQAPEPGAELRVWSDLPIAAGLGSGAAISVAIARALSTYLGYNLPSDQISALAYEVEKIHHGTPSGIDNTVIAWEQPVAFTKGEPPEVFTIGDAFHLLIANSGIHSTTRDMVTGVRQRWETNPERYNTYFKQMGNLALEARKAIEQGNVKALGPLLNQNHARLVDIGVSHPKLDQLVTQAREAGASGAKLTGAGGGGNIIALVPFENVDTVTHALQQAGAVQIWHTLVSQEER